MHTTNQLTTREAALALGVSVRYVQQLIKSGRLRAERPGRDHVIDARDLEPLYTRPGRGRPPKKKI